ncbi:MAG TPA: helix-turn-helix domain-containing protein [Candidatus Baltobacteraceae bacterium]|nr:helix-turn-helix domain-containing protein [Candidatus Baltobacteraceae bacterium]
MSTKSTRNIPERPNLMSPPECSDYLSSKGRTGVEAHTLSVWRLKGIGPAYVKIGAKVFYLREDVDAWIRARRVTTKESPTVEAVA